MDNALCSQVCELGYYCPAGSACSNAAATGTGFALAHECGDGQEDYVGAPPGGRVFGANAYCPVIAVTGRTKPNKVDVGYYSDGGTVNTRQVQVQCELGNFCVNGIKQQCAEGTYVDFAGASSSLDCQTCEAGSYCPPGSVSQSQEPCTFTPGEARYYCRAGEAPAMVNGTDITIPEDAPENRRRDFMACPSDRVCYAGRAYEKLTWTGICDGGVGSVDVSEFSAIGSTGHQVQSVLNGFLSGGYTRNYTLESFEYFEPGPGESCMVDGDVAKNAGIFAINANTGFLELTRNDLNYEVCDSTQVKYELKIISEAVGEDTYTKLKCTLTVNVVDENDTPFFDVADEPGLVAHRKIREKQEKRTVATRCDSAFASYGCPADGPVTGEPGVVAKDYDYGSVLTYSFNETFGDHNGVTPANMEFTINTCTGEISYVNTNAVTYNDAPVYMSVHRAYHFKVIVTDDGTGTLTDEIEVYIHVENINDTPVLSTGTVFSIPENQAMQTLTSPVAPVVTDDDAGDTYTLSLVRNDGGAFEIDAMTGQLMSSSQGVLDIDYETKSTYFIDIGVLDAGGAFSFETYQVNIIDTNDAPRFGEGLNFWIEENAADGTIVCRDETGSCTYNGASPELHAVLATDEDTNVGDSIVFSLDAAGEVYFTIGASTGQISVKSGAPTIDFESAPSLSVKTGRGYRFTVYAESTGWGAGALGSQTVETEVTVFVVDTNEPPVDPGTPFVLSLLENWPVGVTLADQVISTTDPDNADGFLLLQPTIPQTLTYTKTAAYTPPAGGDDGSAMFVVSTNEAGQGVLILSQELDFEALAASITECESATEVGARCLFMGVTVTDNGGPIQRFTELDVIIRVVDTNEPPFWPTSPPHGYAISIEENANLSQAVALVGDFWATDNDVPTVLSYEIVGGDGNGTFGIVYDGDLDGGNGGFTVERAAGFLVDYEATQNTFSLVVRASDQGVSRRVGSGCSSAGDDCGEGANCNAPDQRCYEVCEASHPDVQPLVLGTYFCDYLGGSPSNPYLEYADITITISVTNANDKPFVSEGFNPGVVPSIITESACKVERVVSLENKAILQTPISSLTPYDEDPLNTHTFEMVNATGAFWDSGALFVLDLANGNVTLPGNRINSAIVNDVYNGVVRIRDNSGTATDYSDCAIEITVVTTNEVPEWDNLVPPMTTHVNPTHEGVVPGFVAVTGLTDSDLLDMDSDSDDRVTFSMSYTSLFELNSTSAQVLVNAGSNLNYEDLSPTFSFDVLLVATDLNGGQDSITLTIPITDVNESPFFTGALPGYNVYENDTIGTQVVEELASLVVDPDVYASNPAWKTHTFTTSCDGLVACPFAISNALTGEIVTTQILDFETTPSYTFTVEVHDDADGLLFDSATVVVSVGDINEPPQFIGATSFAIDESDANVAQEVKDLTPSLMDQDVADPVSSLTITIDPAGNPGNLFYVDSGRLMVSGTLDFEATPSYTLLLTVQDSALNEITETLTVTINNLDDVTISSILPQTGTEFECDGTSNVVVTGTNLGVVSGGTSTVSLTYQRRQGPVESLTNPVYNATGCVLTGNTQLTCDMVSGVGQDLVFTVLVEDNTYATPYAHSETLATLLKFKSPSITSVSNSMNMSTGGMDYLVIQGTCLGKGSTDNVEYGSPTTNFDSWVKNCPTMNGDTDCSFPTACASQANGDIHCKSAPGLGADAYWFVQSAQLVSAVGQLSGGYGKPAISSITPSVIPTDGMFSTPLVIVGTNFAATAVDSMRLFFTYQSESLELNGCTVTVAYTTIECTSSDPGLGFDMPVFVEFASQVSTSVSFLVSFESPTVTKISGEGAFQASTVGGQIVSIEGTNFGDSCGSLGTEDEPGVPCGLTEVTYTAGSRLASDGVTIITYSPDCVVISQTRMACVTEPGTGKGHTWTFVVGGQLAVNGASQTDYARPTVGTYEGAGAFDALTEGNQTVLVLGGGFGPKNGAPIYAFYGNEEDPDEFYAGECYVSVKHSRAVCETAVGAGEGLSWILQVDGQNSTTELTNYGAPQVNSFSLGAGASSASVSALVSDGGDVLIIRGENFGAAGGGYLESVTYGPLSRPYAYSVPGCTVIDHDEIRCTTMPGVGRDFVVQLVVRGQSNVLNVASPRISYLTPEMTAISQTRSDTAGGDTMRVAGTGFGICDLSSTPKIRFGSKLVDVSNVYDDVSSTPLNLITDCASGIATATRWLEFVVPDMTEGFITHDISVVVVSMVILEEYESQELFQVSYNSPIIDEVFALPGEVPGTVSVTFLGENFCRSEGCCQTYINGVLSTSVVDHSHTRINVITNSLGSGYVLCPGNSSNVVTFDTLIPSILGTQPPLHETDMRTIGGETFEIWGLYFGGNPNVTMDVDQYPDFVFDGVVSCTDPNMPMTGKMIVANDDSANWECLKITVTVPPGEGVDHEFRVFAGRLKSLPRNVAPFVDTLHYGAPRIDTMTSSPVAISDLHDTDGGGSSITLTGDNFGFSGVVNFAPYNALTEVYSTFQRCTTFSNYEHTTLTCLVPEGVGSNLEAQLVVAGMASPNTGAGVDGATLSYKPMTTTGWSIAGATEFNTAGGNHLVISGANFGPPYNANCAAPGCTLDQPSATVGGVACTFVSNTHTSLTCLTPEGEGTSKVVTATVDGVTVTVPGLLDYGLPEIYSVSPETGPTSGKTPQGDQLYITITGKNFGLDELTVYFDDHVPDTVAGFDCDGNADPSAPGNEVCLLVMAQRSLLDGNPVGDFLVGTDHDSIVMKMPDYYGANISVIVEVQGQISSPKFEAQFSYNAPSVGGISFTAVASDGSRRLEELNTYYDTSQASRQLIDNSYSSNGPGSCTLDFGNKMFKTQDASYTNVLDAATLSVQYYYDSMCLQEAFEVSVISTIEERGFHSSITCAVTFEETVANLRVTINSEDSIERFRSECACVSDGLTWVLGQRVDVKSCMIADECPFIKSLGYWGDKHFGLYLISESEDLYMASDGYATLEELQANEIFHFPDEPTANIDTPLVVTGLRMPTDGCIDVDWEDIELYNARLNNALDSTNLPRRCNSKFLISVNGSDFGSDTNPSAGALRVFFYDTLTGAEYEAATTTSPGNHLETCPYKDGCRHNHTRIVFWAPSGSGFDLELRIQVGNIAPKVIPGVTVTYSEPVIQRVNPGSLANGLDHLDATSGAVQVHGLNFGAANSGASVLINGKVCHNATWVDGQYEEDGLASIVCDAVETTAGPKSCFLCIATLGYMFKVNRGDGLVMSQGLAAEPSVWNTANLANTRRKPYVNRIQSAINTACPIGFTGRTHEVCHPLPYGAGSDIVFINKTSIVDGLPRHQFGVPKALLGYSRYSVKVYEDDGVTPTERAMLRCPESQWNVSFVDTFPDLYQRQECYDYIPCDPEESCLGNNQCEIGYQYAFKRCSAKRNPTVGEVDNSCPVYFDALAQEHLGNHTACRGSLPVGQACTVRNPEACSLCEVSYVNNNGTLTPVGECQCEQPTRCTLCSMGEYFRINGKCEECPASVELLFVMFACLALGALIGGYYLSKKKINLAFVSIGVDYFQVLAILAQSRTEWPPTIKAIMSLMSVFNLNIDIAAPECLIPDFDYEYKWWFTMLLPISCAALLVVTHVSYASVKLIQQCGHIKNLTGHLNRLYAVFIVMFYYLYLSVTKRALDIFNCNPSDPNDGYTYVSFTSLQCDGGNFCRCNEVDGVQARLVPPAVVFLVLYAIGFPAFLFWRIYVHRNAITEDQYLRACGVGDSREENRHYDLRKRYHLMYYHFKPDKIYWIVAIIARKFWVAFASLMFRGNPTFQLAVVLLVLFGSFVSQVQNRPYMSTGERATVLRGLEAKSLKSIDDPNFAYFREIDEQVTKATRTGFELARKEKTSKYKLHRNFWEDTKKGQFKKRSNVNAYFFDFNAVEAILLSSAIFVTLGGIMFESVNKFDQETLDEREDLRTQSEVVETLTITVMIGSVIYYLFVFANEIFPHSFSNVFGRCFLNYNDEQAEEDLSHGLIMEDNAMFSSDGAIVAVGAKTLEKELESLSKDLKATRKQNQELIAEKNNKVLGNSMGTPNPNY